MGLLDELVRPQQQHLRDRQPESLGSLEVYHQLELGGLLDGQVAGLGALKNFVHVDGGMSKAVVKGRSVYDEAASRGVLCRPVHRREAVRRREVHDPCPVKKEHAIRRNQKSSDVLPVHRRKRFLEVIWPTHGYGLQLQP